MTLPKFPRAVCVERKTVGKEQEGYNKDRARLMRWLMLGAGRYYWELRETLGPIN